MKIAGVLLITMAGCGRGSFGLELPVGAPFEPEKPVGTICVERFAVSLFTVPGADMTAPALADRNTVVFQTDSAIFRLDLDKAGRTTQIAPAGSRLIDAGDGIVLAANRDESTVAILSDGSSRELAKGSWRPHLSGPEAARRNIHDSLVMGCTSEHSLGGFDLASNQRFGTRLRSGTCQEPLFVDRPHVVYATHDDRRRTQVIIHWRAEENAQLPVVVASGLTVRAPVVFQDRLYHLDEGAVMAVSLDAPEKIEQIHPGPCVALDVGSAGVIMTCEHREEGMYLPLGSRLILFDGSTQRTLDTGGKMVLNARVSERFVAWLAYDPGTSFCEGGQRLGTVTAVWLDSSEIIEVAQVDLGCFCCGAFWPAPALDVDGDTLVFNYDARDVEGAGPTVSYGAARLRSGCN